MIDNLVIVESPAKAKTIEKFLGKDFQVVSSFGHIRDLSKKNLGIDIENGFIPDYEVSKDKTKVVSELRKQAKEAKNIWIASDEDREGEAIAWHLAAVLDLDIPGTKRIVFHEITKEAISAAIKNPRQIDMNLVNAQQARRILDRLVGFEISPVLWKKVQPSLSAGRVQSVAVRLLVDREREIISFVPESSFRINGLFLTDPKGSENTILKAEASTKFNNGQNALEFLSLCSGAKYIISNISVKPGTRSPSPPFTTSTLQQEAYRKLGFSVAQTMSVAQKLYEAGKITYMRTDSTNLSGLALAKSKETIISEFGEKYSKTRQFKTKTKGAQEAHEAIRPAYFDKPTIVGTSTEKRLYELIWKRAIASQMANALVERTNITIEMTGSPVTFLSTGEVIKFDGFLRVYSESVDIENNDDERVILPPVTIGMPLTYDKISATEKYTSPPPRYTEASLVKKLEELGIGRPSTYAPTITTIQNRGYVVKEDRPGENRIIGSHILTNGKIISSPKSEMAGKEKSKLFPRDIGIIVNDFLMANFSDIMDFHFTALVEKQFDEIAEGEIKWTNMLKEFYAPFHANVSNSLANDKKPSVRILGSHPETGEPVSVRMGRYGPVAQIGNTENEEKPKFASLLKSQLLETITLEEALNLFRLPRKLGEYEGAELSVGIGRFGPYVKHNNKFFSIKKGVDDPYTITLEKAIELILDKNESDKQKVLHDFDDLKVLNGRFGPYITKDKLNYRIPKGTDTATLTKDDCLKIIEKTPTTKPRKNK
jgi:DNA topoisomerase-1